MDISRYFKEVQPLQFVDCDIAYRVRKEHSEAYIAIDGDEVVCSLIQSYKSGAGSDMIATLEQLAKDNGYSMVFSNVINPKLIGMLERRGYTKDYVPFSPSYGIMDQVDVWTKTFGSNQDESNS